MEEKLLIPRNSFYHLLHEWGQLGRRLPNTGIGLSQKVLTNLLVYLKFEEVAFFDDENQEPYTYMLPILKNQIQTLIDLLFFLDQKQLFPSDDPDKFIYDMEQRHQDLWQILFNQYSEKGYEKLIEGMSNRFKINDLSDKVIGKKCLEIGCGGGRQCVSLSRLGAASVVGVDFGVESIKFAEKMKKKLAIGNIRYQIGNAYDLPFREQQFDVVVSNGVFHHLERMDGALAEAFRVLKSGGWMWLYVNGAGGMFNDLMDTIKVIMQGTDKNQALEILRSFGLNEHKMFHLVDGFYATYIYSRWDQLNELLTKIGFKKVRRMSGTNPTDFNLNKIKADPYGPEKFGEGEVRLIACK
ncbi:class I SAM-dependent methyltransferase [candidate division CSSED10-310 bacterium]|uniref:Class I SAM-dependent methyltransferase n=1 Tax=candidate division CSSED10-310 bacterium TaxID=2855610 RepID=A0ABV6YZ08_UNCC1